MLLFYSFLQPKKKTEKKLFNKKKLHASPESWCRLHCRRRSHFHLSIWFNRLWAQVSVCVCVDRYVKTFFFLPRFHWISRRVVNLRCISWLKLPIIRQWSLRNSYSTQNFMQYIIYIWYIRTPNYITSDVILSYVKAVFLFLLFCCCWCVVATCLMSFLCKKIYKDFDRLVNFKVNTIENCNAKRST